MRSLGALLNCAYALAEGLLTNLLETQVAIGTLNWIKLDEREPYLLLINKYESIS